MKKKNDPMILTNSLPLPFFFFGSQYHLPSWSWDFVGGSVGSWDSAEACRAQMRMWISPKGPTIG